MEGQGPASENLQSPAEIGFSEEAKSSEFTFISLPGEGTLAGEKEQGQFLWNYRALREMVRSGTTPSSEAPAIRPQHLRLQVGSAITLSASPMAASSHP